jgi:hypothetical protein
VNIPLACRFIAYAVLLTMTIFLIGSSIGFLLAIIAILIGGARAVFTIGLYDSSVTTAAILIRIIPITIFIWALAFGCVEACRSVWKGIKTDMRNK